MRQVDAKVGGTEGGNRQAARELNIPEAAVRRAYQTASLSPEAQEAAVETGLDDNRSVLLEAAKERHQRRRPQPFRHRGVEDGRRANQRNWRAPQQRPSRCVTS